MIITILLITFLEGRKHDAGMLRDSHMLDDLELHAYSPTGQVMCVYGDRATHLGHTYRLHSEQEQEH